MPQQKQKPHNTMWGINTTKVSLNSYENKRYWTSALDSLAYGHYKINDFKND